MIHVFFVPGMFGSTIEHIIRNYSNEYAEILQQEPTKLNDWHHTQILSDGSMHGFQKECHVTGRIPIKSELELATSAAITTPIYPFKTKHLPEILEEYTQFIGEYNKQILIYASNTRHAELNMLFQYHKIASGSYNKGLEIFCHGNEHNIINWNKNYTHWSNMKPWELREWISLFYVHWVQEWIESHGQVSTDFCRITNTEILENLPLTTRTIFKHCGLTECPGLDDFAMHWRSKQKYITDEFDLLDRVVECTINNMPLIWNCTNIIAEAIVQQRLRANGYEIRCDGLDVFPTNARILHTLLEKVHT